MKTTTSKLLELYHKYLKVLESCETVEQLQVAVRYSDLVTKEMDRIIEKNI